MAVQGRWLSDPPLPGAENMARDEALLDLRRLPSLRFYAWAKPTLSLGYFQSASALPIAALRQRGIDVVRRSTGGKAILHHEELTYSLCAPEQGPLAGGPAAAMERIHSALAQALSNQLEHPLRLRGQQPLASDRAGSAWCFEDSSPLDLALDGRKLLGSAARRRQGWILFHGSLVLQAPAETPGVAAMQQEPNVTALVQALESSLDMEFAPGHWSREELSLAAEIRKKKFSQAAHTFSRP
ncbi:MAG: lipoate--protein ligase [Planctomycetota bacterium]|nr:MAG: lipoate--protein ligase [Planctomycetota bacterium]